MSPKMLTYCSELLVILKYSQYKGSHQFWQRQPCKKGVLTYFILTKSVFGSIEKKVWRKNANLPPRAKICIFKKIALFYYKLRTTLFFWFFDFYISYANLRFFRPGDQRKKWLFHHFFCIYPHPITMTKTENKDFAWIFFKNKSL